MPLTEALGARLDALVAQIEPELIELRRHLHANPELGWQEFKTQQHLHDWLEARGIGSRRCASTGLLADIGPTDGPRVLYRGDIDALPIQEATDAHKPYTSTRDGVMHACGHDVHASVASGMAWILHQLEDDLPTGVRIALQPAEEVVPSGAEAMIRDGAATGVVAGLALHVDPSREIGTVGVRRGALTSATDAFEVRITGQEGHSARPHLARDAILAAANVTQALYTLVTQRVNPVVPAVLNVGGIRGGVAKNVIAGDCFLDGVVRTLDLDARERLHQEMRTVVEHVATAHGCRGTIIITTGAPPVMNDHRLNDIVTESAHEVLGPENVHPIDVPSTGAEDFGMFGIHMPTYMMRLGVRAPGDETHHLHTPAFDIDERAIGLALRVMGRSMFRTMHEAKTWD